MKNSRLMSSCGPKCADRPFTRIGLASGAALALGAGFLAATPSTATPAPAAVDESVTASATTDRAKKKRQKKTVARGKIRALAGMRLIAVNSSGHATVRVLGGRGAFKVPVQRGTSLHLTTSDGEYYGPIMLHGNGKKGKKKGKKGSGLITGSLNYAFFKPGRTKSINLGKIRLRNGWAAPNKPLAARLVERKKSFSSLARKGVPLGAGNGGRVAVATAQLRNAANHPAADLDRDGVISAFDVDDNGNLILDNVDTANLRGNVRSARDAGPEGSLASEGFRMFSNYKATEPSFSDVINANVAVPTTAQLDASTRSKLGLAVQVIPGATLGCTGQLYCPATPQPITAGPSGDFQWNLASTYPALTAADVNAGDTFVETAPDGTSYPGILNFVFRTTPALVSYQVMDADGVTPVGAAVPVDYANPNPAGSANNRINVTTTQKVLLTFWRPQRQAFAGESGGTGGYVDIGKLSYMADAPNLGAGGCSAVAGDANGTTVPDGTWTNVQDNLDDAPTTAGRTLAMVVNAGACAEAGGRTAADPGQAVFDLDIQAKSLYNDNSAQKVYLQLVPVP
ncbi:MAG: hypothetical protein Q8P61_05515 [Candidatus Nanopelagicales bacterium]|nr:hypothetical protein [Candidatus Nanopelagicales bacterium]